MSVLAAAGLFADGDTDKGSPIGLFVVLILIVAVYFLYRSMSRHLRKVPADFNAPDRAEGASNDSNAVDPNGAAASNAVAPDATAASDGDTSAVTEKTQPRDSSGT